uniref:Uncharacterized protein n=1 Tax=Zea mays TaxID=4577 RepID=C0PHT3_MAIZE|nr:unknown [Zea mays]
MSFVNCLYVQHAFPKSTSLHFRSAFIAIIFLAPLLPRLSRVTRFLAPSCLGLPSFVVPRSPRSSDPSVSADATALLPSEVAATARLAFFRIFFFWFLVRPPFPDCAGTLGGGSSVLIEGGTRGTPDFRGSFVGSMVDTSNMFSGLRSV